jgi:hypothetical protein
VVVREHAAAVRAQQRWRGRPTGGVVERKTCGRRGDMAEHDRRAQSRQCMNFFYINCVDRRRMDRNG